MKSVKMMIVGIALILVALYIQGESGINLRGYEFFILMIGVITILIGYLKKEKSNSNND
jgi:uncharacterized membrane protein YiaA